MTELKAKGPRAAHVEGGALSPAAGASPLPFAAGPPAAPLSVDGLLFPRDPDSKIADRSAPSNVDTEYPRAEVAGGSRHAEKDSGLLDSVLDTLLAPSGRGHSHPTPPASEAASPWYLFGPELPEDPRGAPASRGPLPSLMSRPEAKGGECPGAAQKALPRGLSPSRQLLPALSGTPHWPRPVLQPSPQPAVVDVEDDDDDDDDDEEDSEAEAGGAAAGQLPQGKARALGDPLAVSGTAGAGGVALVPREDPRFAAPRTALAEAEAPGRSPLGTAVVDFIHVPILPLKPAILTARTRQLLETDGPDGAGPAARASPGDLPACAYAPTANAAEPRDDDAAFALYGDPHPAALKIKEEEEGCEAAARPQRPFPPAPAAVYTDLALAPPLPPRAPSARPGELAAGPSPSGSALECLLYKAEDAPPTPPAPPPPCKAPVGGGCLLPRDALSTPAAAGPALYQPLGLNGLPPLGYQAAVLKDALPQVYPPYLNYLRPDAEASPNPQYGFESLPQKICLICGDEASGCHYGVLTCGSCKVFFKRAMEGQHNYLCAGRNDCIVDKIRRKNCPACRLRKCCQAGMVLGGRKFKKFNKVRVMRALDAVSLQQQVGLPGEGQALAQRMSFSPSQDIQLIPSLISLLMSIEPEVVYAGHDNSKPDTSSSLLTSLNQLGERQLLSVVKWSKSLPGFRNLHIDDQITLIQYSWMSLMVFGLGWRSYKHVSGKMLYFAPDLILNEQRMKESSFYSLCLTMWQIPQEFVKLQVSHEEFLCMKVLLLLNTIPLEGLRSQNQFEEMRSSYIRELIKAIGLRQKGVVSSSQRFYQLTKLLDSLHDLVKQLHLYCLNTFIQSRSLSVEFPEMMSEVIAAQLPKILAGMVKPLLFHKK
ncbi:progesterone receptor [Sorex fumeus]|uniref:progesterone receptor n=1 Tax=Sorex fumeus TaxID=62283 RepID=UPI0024AD333A|nr:progesterone receptor [Sorex fumeus]